MPETAMPAIIRLIRYRYAPLAILAGASVLAACSPSGGKADQAAAAAKLRAAGSDLKAAAGDTVQALNAEADAAKPALKTLARDTDRGAAKLAAATGDAAAGAGAALDTAGHKADVAAHKAALAARARADATPN
jgi:hypothetical protein